MKKYLNPEYVNVVAMAEDVITLSVDSMDVTPTGANYSQTKNVTYDDNGNVVSVDTIVSANVNTLLGI